MRRFNVLFMHFAYFMLLCKFYRPTVVERKSITVMHDSVIIVW